jgi:hypothetical protein
MIYIHGLTFVTWMEPLVVIVYMLCKMLLAAYIACRVLHT